MSRYEPASNVFSRNVGEELVLLDVDSGEYFGLDRIGRILWEGVCEGQSQTAICAQIAEQFDVSVETVRGDIDTLLAELVARGILKEIQD